MRTGPPAGYNVFVVADRCRGPAVELNPSGRSWVVYPLCNPPFAHHRTNHEIHVCSVMKLLSGIVVVASGLCLIGFAVVIALKPQLAERFLKAFASSARTHYTEQAARLIAGAAIVLFAPSMWYPDLFEVLGWLLFGTAVGLLLVPWQWHRRFGEWAIPLALRHLKIYATGAFALGTLILFGVSRAVLS